MCLEHCWNVIATIYGMRGEGFTQELVWEVGERVTGIQSERSYPWHPSGMCWKPMQCNSFIIHLGTKRGLSLGYLSVIWRGTGLLMLKRMEHHSSERTRGSIRETETEWIAEAESAKPGAQTHEQGPCVRGIRAEMGNVEWWLKSCEPPVWYCWDSISDTLKSRIECLG